VNSRKEQHGEMQFHTTRWDLVTRSGDIGSPMHQKSPSEFCSRYWYPLYNFARYKGFSDEDAQDLTQGFFLHLLDKVSLKHADPSRGRFRSFLLASFQNYMSETVVSLQGGGLLNISPERSDCISFVQPSRALLHSDSILHLHAPDYTGSVFVKKENVDFLSVTQKELIG
jgi:hypothetical protein